MRLKQGCINLGIEHARTDLSRRFGPYVSLYPNGGYAVDKNYVTTNRDVWNADAENWVSLAEELWALDTPRWGNWGNSEDDLHLLPVEMNELNAVELGCGTGYVAYWMHRRGAQVTGIDISIEQLHTARRLAQTHDAQITFIEGNAEATGLPEGAFDFAISEYGASIWCPPETWLREA